MKEKCFDLLNPTIGISKRIEGDRELIRSILDHGVSEDSKRELMGHVIDSTSETLKRIEISSGIKAQLNENLMDMRELITTGEAADMESILRNYDVLYNDLISALIDKIVVCECHAE